MALRPGYYALKEGFFRTLIYALLLLVKPVGDNR